MVAPKEEAKAVSPEVPARIVESEPALESSSDESNSATETELAGESEELLVEEVTEEEVVAELKERGGVAIDSQHSDSSRVEQPVSPAAVASMAQTEPGPTTIRGTAPQCVSCGTSIRALDKFCIWCGEKQPERSPPQMKRCADCKTQLPVSANFCFVCGNDVGVHPRRRIRVPMELFQEEDPELFPTFET